MCKLATAQKCIIFHSSGLSPLSQLLYGVCSASAIWIEGSQQAEKLIYSKNCSLQGVALTVIEVGRVGVGLASQQLFGQSAGFLNGRAS